MTPTPRPCLPIQPFLDELAARPYQDRHLTDNRRLYRKLERARTKGTITYPAADELAIHYLHKHPAEIWGPEAWTNT